MVAFTARFSVVFFLLFFGPYVYADDTSPVKAFNPHPSFVTIQEFGILDVNVWADAKITGLSRDHLTDFLRLRFRNTFAGMPFKEPDNLYTATKDIETAKKIGRIYVHVWTVGTSYPVVYHVSIEAGNLARCSRRDYKNAVLGYVSKDEIASTVRQAISEMVDDVAVAFFKARGSL